MSGTNELDYIKEMRLHIGVSTAIEVRPGEGMRYKREDRMSKEEEAKMCTLFSGKVKRQLAVLKDLSGK